VRLQTSKPPADAETIVHDLQKELCAVNAQAYIRYGHSRAIRAWRDGTSCLAYKQDVKLATAHARFT